MRKENWSFSHCFPEDLSLARILHHYPYPRSYPTQLSLDYRIFTGRIREKEKMKMNRRSMPINSHSDFSLRNTAQCSRNSQVKSWCDIQKNTDFVRAPIVILDTALLTHSTRWYDLVNFIFLLNDYWNSLVGLG